MESNIAAKIRDYYRGAELVGRLIAECESFEELNQALQNEYELESYPGASEPTEAQKAIMEVRNKLNDWKEGEKDGSNGTDSEPAART